MSSVAAAKSALLALLQGRSGLSAVAVTRTGPTQASDIQDEMVFLGLVDFTHAPGVFAPSTSLGGTWPATDEEYTINLHVRVRRWGDDDEAPETRAWEIHDEIEKALRDSPTLGTAVWAARLDGGVQGVGPFDPEAWGAWIDSRVICREMI